MPKSNPVLADLNAEMKAQLNALMIDHRSVVEAGMLEAILEKLEDFNPSSEAKDEAERLAHEAGFVQAVAEMRKFLGDLLVAAEATGRGAKAN